MNKSFNEAGVQVVWDSTSLSLAETCLRKYQLKLIEGWTPRGRLSVHLKFGQHYATSLEHFYKHLALGMDYEDAVRAVVLEALEATWERELCETCLGEVLVPAYENIPGVFAICPACGGTGYTGVGMPWQSDYNLKTRETLIRSIVWYLEQFRDDSTTVVMINDDERGLRPAVEYSFLLPVDNGIIFSGHLDRLVEYSGQYMVMDQKTTGITLSPRFFDQFSPNTQMSMYTFAGKAIWQVPVKGVIIDAAQIAVGFTRFERGLTFRTPSQLDEWYDGAMQLIESVQLATERKEFPQRPASCGNYGGCEFRHICSRSPEVRPNFLKGDFEQHGGWDPLSRR